MELSLYGAVQQALTAKSCLESKKMLYFEGSKLGAREFLAHVDILADYLSAHGVTKGSVVAMNLPNTINACVAVYAVNKAGGILNSIHPLLPVSQIKTLLKETNSALFITLDAFYSDNQDELRTLGIPMLIARISDYLPKVKSIFYKAANEKLNEERGLDFYKDVVWGGKHTPLNPVPQVASTDAAVYLHSSGTTGRAKTVILSNGALNNLAKSLRSVLPDGDVTYNNCLAVLPFFHGFGLGVCLHTMLCHGIAVTLVPKFDNKKTAKQVAKNKCTITAGVPSMFEKWLKLNNADFKKLKTFEFLFVGGERLPYSLKKEFDGRLNRIGSTAELLEGYGLTETASVACVSRPNDYEPYCVGYPLEGVSFDISDGEICVAGDTLMTGYLNEIEDWGTVIDGKRYLKTGDLGYIKNNKIFFSDRKKRMFKISGVNVYPADIECAVLELDFIKNCYAAFHNHKIVLFVETADGGSDIYTEKILDFCREKVIPYGVPREIKYCSEFPKNPSGKIDCQALEKSLGE